MSLGEKQLQSLSPWFVAASLRVLSGGGRVQALVLQGFFSRNFAGSPSVVTLVQPWWPVLIHWQREQLQWQPRVLTVPWTWNPQNLLAVAVFAAVVAGEVALFFVLCSSVTGVVIDAAKASRAAFYCWSQAAELIISGRIDQSESRKVLSAVAVEFSAKQEVAFIWFTHCEMLSFNNSLRFNPSSFLL